MDEKEIIGTKDPIKTIRAAIEVAERGEKVAEDNYGVIYRNTVQLEVTKALAVAVEALTALTIDAPSDPGFTKWYAKGHLIKIATILEPLLKNEA